MSSANSGLRWGRVRRRAPLVRTQVVRVQYRLLMPSQPKVLPVPCLVVRAYMRGGVARTVVTCPQGWER